MNKIRIIIGLEEIGMMFLVFPIMGILILPQLIGMGFFGIVMAFIFIPGTLVVEGFILDRLDELRTKDKKKCMSSSVPSSGVDEVGHSSIKKRGFK